MSLYKPKDSPYWHFDFVVKGRRFYGSTGVAEKTAARSIEAAERLKAVTGALKRPHMSVDVATEKYYQEKGKHLASSATVNYQLDNLVDGLKAATLLADVDGGTLAEYVARRRANVSNASVNREIELLRRVYKRADKVWRVDVGEMPNWSEILLPEPEGRVRELTDAEEGRLFAELRPDFHAMARFAIWTGLRLSNVIGLRWDQVDFDAKVIRLKVKSRKPGGEARVLPITPLLMALLQGERRRHKEFVFTYECHRRRPERRRGDRYPFTKTGWRRPWKAALSQAKVSDFRFHDTRHTAATRVLRVSGNLKLTKDMLGHRNIATTARYAHVLVDDVARAMEATQSRTIPEAVAGGESKALIANAK